MCGIAGIIRPGGEPGELESVIKRMADTLVHRGPDDSRVWVDAHAGVALGHRRLSIIDLTSEGSQPMISGGGRYVISYNGEVYNFPEIRSELEGEGVKFRGRSDTEVILEAITRWGVEAAVKRFTGMFAFALWDKEERTLHLVRDRLGIKPLYYSAASEKFTFGSELKALCADPGFRRVIGHRSAALYFHYGYIPAPYTIYENTYTLQPGSILSCVLRYGKISQPGITSYWSPLEVAENGKRNPLNISDEEAGAELERLLKDSVRMRMISDVPLGAFLSGGIDSSAIVALMQSDRTDKVRTFTIGFEDDDYNEAGHARKVAAHLGTDHTEIFLSEKEAMDVIPSIPEMYDEPFADPSQIPTYLVSRLTRKQVTVALSGDGGDELFGGYEQYARVESEWRIKGSMLPARRAAAAAALRLVARPEFNWLMAPAIPLLLLKGKNFSNMRERALHRARGLEAADFDAFYNNSRRIYPNIEDLLKNTAGPDTIFTDPQRKAKSINNPVERMMYIDLNQYLPDDILVKVDRASMAVSLESRVPMIDHRVVEFAWRLPYAQRVGTVKEKRLLRRLLYKYVPQEIVDRPKMGFGVPVGRWIKGPLRDWAETYLSEKSLGESGLFKPASITKKWKEHKAGTYNHEFMLWSVLMYQTWQKKWGAGRGG